MAVGIAGMLLSLPYESNAIEPVTLTIIGASLISFGVGLLIGYLADKNAENNVFLDTMDNTFDNLESYKDKMHNVYKTIVSHFSNTIRYYDNSELYFTRVAEKEVMEYLDEENWTTEIENAVCEELDNFTVNVINGMIISITNWVADWVFELNGLKEYSGDGYIKVEMGSTLMIKSTNQREITTCTIGLSNIDLETSQINQSVATISYEQFNLTKIREFYGLSSTNIVFKFKNDNNDQVSFTDKVFSVEGTGTGIQGIIDGQIHRSLSLGGYEFGQYIDDIHSSYKNIRQNVINSAQSYWNYLHSLGYHNITDVPETYVPVYPDVFLYDFLNLLNISEYNESFAVYYALMEQLLEQLNEQLEQNNSEPINWTTLDIGNFTGKKANITLCEATPTNGSTSIIIDADLCYIIPYKDLTLESNKTYALTMNETKPSWADELLNHDRLGIFDLNNFRWYFITTNETTYYNLTVHECYEGNETKDSITISVDDAGKITYYLWGFGYNPITSNVPTITTEDNWLSWVEEHKGLIVIGCIVLGILLTASSKKGSGGHTIGIILLVAGVGLAFYWYILPAWDAITFWD